MALALGGIVFAAGLALASAWLPEWQGAPSERLAVERFRELAAQAGVRLAPGEPRVVLRSGVLHPVHPALDGHEPQEFAALGAGLSVEVSQAGELPGSGGEPPEVPTTGELAVTIAPGGRPVRLAWDGPAPAGAEPWARLLLAPGERLGEGREVSFSTLSRRYFALAGSRPAQHLDLRNDPGEPLWIARGAGPVELAAGRLEGPKNTAFGCVLVAAVIAVAITFIVLLARRRLSVANGAVLAAVGLAAAVPPLVATPAAEDAVVVVLAAMVVAATWAAGESLLRAIDPRLTAALDGLRRGRLGPSEGTALLMGLSAGAALAGLGLAAEALAVRLPGAGPRAAAVELPAFDGLRPLGTALLVAAAVAFVLAAALRRLPAPAAVAVVAATLAALWTLLPDASPAPWPLAFVISAVALGGLAVLCRRHGTAALLAAALTAPLLPVAALAVFATRHAALVPWQLAAAAGLPLVLLASGLVGLSRAADPRPLPQPAFVHRLEEERRLRHELDLLARMQIGLLPKELPEVPGWDLAVRSLLATEAGGDLYDAFTDDAGRLWVAAGDVAGHGYSCSIAQAMVTAALASLVEPEATPAGVLRRIDGVLRAAGLERTFTTLVLLRLDPATGEGLLANAGHPYPLRLGPREVGEIREVPQPSLPLGQGPAREYADLPLVVAPDEALVLCSDGVFEAVGRDGAAYGYERPHAPLSAVAGHPAAEILEALLADWRRHAGAGTPADDTTVLVLKRQAAAQLERSVA